MAKKIRVGVVGTGFGRYHMDAYSKQEDVELCALCDLNVPEAKEFADKYSVSHDRVFADYREMFSLPDLDVVSIAVPNNLHAPMAIDALNKGKHVLVEKPMAINAQQAKSMVAAASKAGKRLMVEQAMRFGEDVQLLKALVDRGELGDIYYARSSWIRRKGWPKLNFPPGGTMGRGEWFIRKEEAGHGALSDIGVHMLDLVWYLMGTPKPLSASGMMWNKVAAPILKRRKLPCEVDEMTCGVIRLEGGRAITIEISWDSHNQHLHEARLYGDKAGATLFPAKVFRGEDVLETVELSNCPGGLPITDAWSHFISCVRDPKKRMIASGEEIVRVVQMLDALALSADTGREVRIK
jgi:predicted dehydrogenase